MSQVNCKNKQHGLHTFVFDLRTPRPKGSIMKLCSNETLEEIFETKSLLNVSAPRLAPRDKG
eukprot:m.176175 g.176175  ORF g.176175 m.176175 type:complete len:62 (-) comp14895_c0_seq14:2840-3025(-)